MGHFVLPRWVRILGQVVAGLLALIGLAGVPEDVKRWGGWIASLDGDGLRWVFVIVGMIVTVALQFLTRKPDPKPRVIGTPGFVARGTGYKSSESDRVTRREDVFDESGRIAGREIVHESGKREGLAFPETVAIKAGTPTPGDLVGGGLVRSGITMTARRRRWLSDQLRILSQEGDGPAHMISEALRVYRNDDRRGVNPTPDFTGSTQFAEWHNKVEDFLRDTPELGSGRLADFRRLEGWPAGGEFAVGPFEKRCEFEIALIRVLQGRLDALAHEFHLGP